MIFLISDGIRSTYYQIELLLQIKLFVRIFLLTDLFS